MTPACSALSHRRFSCLVLWLAYLVYRKLNRATRWPGIQKATARFMQKYPPFRSQKLVLDIDEM